MKYIQFLDGYFPDVASNSGSFIISTAVDGGRNMDNDFIGQVVGSDKYKYEILMRTLDPEQIREYLRRFDRTQDGSFVSDFIVFDPARNDFVQKTMYVGDRSGNPFKVHPNGRPERFLDIKSNLIEV